MRKIVVTRGTYADRLILMQDPVADIAVADGWAKEVVGYTRPPDLTDLSLHPKTLRDFEAAILRGKISTDTPEGVGGGGPSGGVPEGATVHIDFLGGPTGFVLGTGDVDIATLVGSNPGYNDSTYDPAGITQYGYDPRTFGDGNAPLALIGPLLAAVLRGDSLVFKFQSDGGDYDVTYSAYQDFALNIEDSIFARGVYFYSQATFSGTTGSVNVEASGGENMYFADAWAYYDTPGGVNAAGFTFVPVVRIEMACNDEVSDTATMVEGVYPNPFANAKLDCGGPLVSITTFPTLTLAELKAKTKPIL